MTPEEYDKIRKDLDYIIKQTQDIHGFLFGNQEHENPARSQLKDLSAKFSTVVQRVEALEQAANSNKIDKLQTLWKFAARAGSMLYTAIITVILAYLIVGNSSSANPIPKIKPAVEDVSEKPQTSTH